MTMKKTELEKRAGALAPARSMISRLASVKGSPPRKNFVPSREIPISCAVRAIRTASFGAALTQHDRPARRVADAHFTIRSVSVT